MVEKRYSEGLGEFTNSFFIPAVEIRTTHLINKLNDPHQVLLMNNRGGQHLPGPVSTLLIPTSVKGQSRMDLTQLFFIVDIIDIERFPGICYKTDDTLPINAHPDL
ncbi:hypothetical protein SAMN02745220_02541 [Desulfopila aestuarii DSM 18488]|uniref:Uncharacterized protein n=1 Tax=Desulfopila aestuarii DSM 18488 TaxID=1121416 RepID=A0A1M7Y8F6_9BACT|nr:hypothetical protein [Desulfopila aestuarii]SHO48925.1 hypothetical protein SAMN02745220_02541 [Desulfopila aestuarii DSM 18488]